MALSEKVTISEETRKKLALEMLIRDRKNEFRELAQSVFAGVPSSLTVPNWDEHVLKFCLELDVAFKRWTGQDDLLPNSDLKALTILRQLGRNKTSMNQLTHLLNIAFDLAQEYKVIKKRIA